MGANLYRNAENKATCTEKLRALHRHGKPVVITEFGCCTFTGAKEQGGMGFTAVDWEREPAVVKEGFVRCEREQADEIGALLDLYAAERVHGAPEHHGPAAHPRGPGVGRGVRAALAE
ncbi:hypothetical protein [Streptomyces sp. NPDC002187]|uniref:hypothetical protein n=1 Tax=Streptomyces sp. NPDC002187 TaxID=3364637 RepID=UPI0036ABB283